ncbi:MAG: hypothetical protein HC890_18725 [Chloroflexaceae bacterium]|nr:hypothetical protein [Chloroflexaceae bacterium]
MRSRRNITPDLATRLARLVAGLVSGVHLTFVLGLGLATWYIGPWKLAYGIPTVVEILLLLPLVATALTVLLVVLALIVRQHPKWSLGRQIYYQLVTAAALIFIPILLYWNLLDLTFLSNASGILGGSTF